jgi:hypothetical protein
MARQVTFDCKFTQGFVEVAIEEYDTKKDVKKFKLTKSGEKTVLLEDGKYVVRIRAQGTPGTAIKVEVTKGGSMNAFEDTFPPEGATSGTRVLKVPEQKKDDK